MREQKFTPGFWTHKDWAITGPAAADSSISRKAVVDFCGDRREVLLGIVAQVKPGHKAVATIHGETRDEVDANARLIAAAPELLAVLREVGSYLADRSDVLDGDDGRPAPNPEMTLLREVDAAIAKATGDAP